jgi:hypothetical protein
MCISGAATRYLFPLEVLLLWLFVAMTRDRSPRVRTLCGTASLWMVLVNLPRMGVAPVPDLHWSEYAPKLRAGEEVVVPINPAGWTFAFPARKR